VSAHLSDLSACRLDQLLPKALERLRGATLDELAELLGRSTSASVAPSADALARAILALPGTGSKLRAAERAVILHALKECDGNVSATSRLLGLDRKALERKIRRIRRGK
jgi:transcriptional regulator of acetoin/glycerol metabolism